jgi:hypothetical protein
MRTEIDLNRVHQRTVVDREFGGKPFTAEDAPPSFDDWRPNPFPEKGWEDLIKLGKEINGRGNAWLGIIIWGLLFTVIGVFLTLALMSIGE